MLTRTTTSPHCEAPLTKKRQAESTNWEQRIRRLLACPEKSVHDIDPRHLLRDVRTVLTTK